MNRLQLATEVQQIIEAFKASYTHFDPDGRIYEGTNLVEGDHLRIDNSWEGVVLGGERGSVWFCVPDWGALILPIDLVFAITDRAGPNGETMPIYDAQPMLRSAAEADPKAVRAAAAAARRKAKAARAKMLKQLQAALDQLPKRKAASVRKAMRKSGLEV